MATRAQYSAPLAFETIKQATHAKAFLFTLNERIYTSEREIYIHSEEFDRRKPEEFPLQRYKNAIQTINKTYGESIQPAKEIVQILSRYSTDQEIIDFVIGVHYDRGSQASTFHLSKYGTAGLSYASNIGKKRRVRYENNEQNDVYAGTTRKERWDIMLKQNRFDSKAGDRIHACLTMLATFTPTKLYKQKEGELYTENTHFEDLSLEDKKVYQRLATTLNGLGEERLDLEEIAREKHEFELFWNPKKQLDIFLDNDH